MAVQWQAPYSSFGTWNAIGMLTLAPATGTPSRLIGFILNSLDSFRAAEPNSWSGGFSELTEQSLSVPLALTVQVIVAWPLTLIRLARSG